MTAAKHLDPTTPRERPILMSAPLVRAILSGAKTQTRRVVKPQPPEWVGRITVGTFAPAVTDRFGELAPGPEHFGAYDDSGEWGARCPYGAPGDRLWVRETWRTSSSGRHYPTQTTTIYVEWREQAHSRGHPRGGQHQSRFVVSDDESDALIRSAYGTQMARADRLTWRPSIHMPRWASRITLEITGVRVERLHDISEADALAEGVEADDIGKVGIPCYSARQNFGRLWRSINGADSWDANPWVWAITFRRVLGSDTPSATRHERRRPSGSARSTT